MNEAEREETRRAVMLAVAEGRYPTLTGVRYDLYPTIRLEGDADAEAEAAVTFAQYKRAQIVVVRDSTGKAWIFDRSVVVGRPALPAPVPVGPQPTEPPALPAPTPAPAPEPETEDEPEVHAERRAFRARLPHHRLKRFVELLRAIGSDSKGRMGCDFRLTLGRTGIHVSAVDPSHIKMGLVDLPASAFDELTAPKGGMVVGVDIEKLTDFLRLGKRNDPVDLRFEEREGKLRMVTAVGFVTRESALVDPEGITDPKIPTVSPTATGSVPTDALLTALKSAESFSDHVVLEAAGELTATAKGEADGSGALLGKVAGQGKAMYPLADLGAFVRALKGAETVDLGFGVDYPMRLAGVADGVEATYLLAPRVEED